MKEWKLISTKVFNEELENIKAYIEDILLSPETAFKQYNRIKKTMLDLKIMPERNPLFKDEPWRSRGLRMAIVDNYEIYYIAEKEKKEVVFLHVIYGGRDTEKYL